MINIIAKLAIRKYAKVIKWEYMNQKERKLNYRKISGYTSMSILSIISLIALLSLIVIPKVSVFKAKGQQSEARIKLVKIYNSMYAYKLENGSFVNTQKKVFLIENVSELDPYLKEEVSLLNNKNDKIYLISTQDQFAIAYVKVLNNGKLDVQRINSKKIFCYMLNGIEANSENCHPQQNYNFKEVKKLLLLEND